MQVPDTLVYGPERRRYIVAIVIAVCLVVLTLGMGLAYFIGAFLFMALGAAWLSGALRGSAVAVSERQLPDIHAMTQHCAARLGIRDVPRVYVIEQGGVLNALAARVLSRRYIVLYSDLVAVARNEGDHVVAFVLSHELAHHGRNHIHKSMFLAPVLWIPFFGQAYSRACEYTCDAIATWACPSGAEPGLALLAAGPVLYREIDTQEFARQRHTEGGFWVRLVELLSTHPRLPKRMAHVQQVRQRLELDAGHSGPVAFRQPEAAVALPQ